MSDFPPLSLYIHFPWCIRKCPYCDFNSHAVENHSDDYQHYVQALIEDFSAQYAHLIDRPIETIFIGGGTPSLLPGKAIKTLLSAIRKKTQMIDDIEITMEANPGTVDADHFADYRENGVNRLSIGIQSFDNQALKILGRIHDQDQAVAAYQTAVSAGFDNINLDLMFGLPHQTLELARRDLRLAMELGPTHLSWYQLTMEPNTPFGHTPPVLPEEEDIDVIQETGLIDLADSGYERYEVSAFATPGQQCRHNLNYWEFGDYIGIGAGAHGKLTNSDGHICRIRKERSPNRYLAAPGQSSGETILEPADLPIEFMMNALRLKHGFNPVIFEQRTGLSIKAIEKPLASAVAKGLLDVTEQRIVATQLGFRFLNDLIGIFDDEQ